MTVFKELVCLANSVKLGDYCFAGVERDTLGWVRPIGSGDHGAVTKAEQRLPDGSIAALLDVVRVPLAAPKPLPGQPENWLLAKGDWERVVSLTGADAGTFLESLVTTDPVFGTTGKSVPVKDVAAGHVTESLAVVKPEGVAWRYEGPTKLYAEFSHCDTSLSLKVTDPVFVHLFDGDKPARYRFEDDDKVTTYLVVSLPEEWKGAHWKLVAGVIRLP